MNQYEITFIVDPVLSHDEIESTAKAYQAMVTDDGCSIVNVDRLGLKQLAYPINKRSSGVFYCVEFNGDSGGVIPKMELALRRDERIMRFLTVKLDKYGVKYNEDKRAGKIGTVKKDKEEKKDDKKGRSYSKRNIKPVDKKPEPATATPPEAKTAEVKPPEVKAPEVKAPAVTPEVIAPAAAVAGASTLIKNTSEEE